MELFGCVWKQDRRRQMKRVGWHSFISHSTNLCEAVHIRNKAEESNLTKVLFFRSYARFLESSWKRFSLCRWLLHFDCTSLCQFIWVVHLINIGTEVVLFWMNNSWRMDNKVETSWTIDCIYYSLPLTLSALFTSDLSKTWSYDLMYIFIHFSINWLLTKS